MKTKQLKISQFVENQRPSHIYGLGVAITNVQML